MRWRNLAVSACGTHHLDERGKPAYAERFDEVLKFHAPGLAPVRRGGLGWHVRSDGSAAYDRRFIRTFGYYEGLAAVVAVDGWHHVTAEGSDAYARRHAWCGNFQQGRCAVRDRDGGYFHITSSGEDAYRARWRYAGDYRDGIAVVQAVDGHSTHIRLDGSLLHERWFVDLDVFHKGFARARDESGWMHVDLQGRPAYARRFDAVEPFYNGQARVELQDGALEVIDETGETLVELRPARRTEFASLSGDMVGFWRTQTIAAAVELGVIEVLPATDEEVVERCGLHADGARRLLRALGELSLVVRHDDQWTLTARGELLRANHALTLADAAVEYAGPFTAMWARLPDALRKSTARTAPDVFGDVARDEARCVGHHRMLRSYARHDYGQVIRALELSGDERVIDAGGGLGVLAQRIIDAHPSAEVTVLERPEVVAMAPPASRVRWRAGSLFEPWGIEANVVVLSRVLHDWDDAEALQILRRARAALFGGGRLYVVEMLVPDESVAGALCDLHLLMATGGRERSAEHFKRLFSAAGVEFAGGAEATRAPVDYRWGGVMTEAQWQIPPSTLRLLARAPTDRAIVVLLRHSVRDHLPPGDAGYVIPITDVGRRLALELGGHLRGRLRTLHASPLLRCVQTAEALAEGAGVSLTVVPDRLLGDPGVFVLDGRRAWANWERLGHEGVVEHLVNETAALSGMARPDEAARFLVQSMLGEAASRPGVHVFVTHDLLVTATAARLLGRPLGVDDWPWYLEGAFFWLTGDGVHAAYRGEAIRPAPLCGLAEDDVAEFARREIAATVGLDSGARFFLAGGAFKSLLTGRPPRDLDLWAPSERDRNLLLVALRDRGARPAGVRPFADAFEVAGRIIEVPHSTASSTLAGLLARFDIALSAVGIEHRPNDKWTAMVHPLALESMRRREVRLLKPLVNWKYVLTTLERMRRYAQELCFSVPAEEEAEVWRVFEAQDAELRAGLIERYLRTGSGSFNIMEEVACRK